MTWTHMSSGSNWTILTLVGLVLSRIYCSDGGEIEHQLTQHQIAEIDSFVEELLQCMQIPGMSVTVTNAQDVVLSKGYGYSDLENKVKVTIDTLFPIASNTKAFTATLLGILMSKQATEDDANRFDWDSPLYKILPSDFQLFDDSYTMGVTLRDLLAHRTGLPSNFVPLLAGYDPNMSLAEMIRTLRYHKPVTSFRNQPRYNNYMVALAGYVAEVMGGADWETLVTEHLFVPLNMTTSTFVRKTATSNSLSKSYALHDGRLREVNRTSLNIVNPVAPAGAIVASARDMAAWLQFLLRGGTLPSGHRLISEASHQETLHSRHNLPLYLNTRDMVQPQFPITDFAAFYGLSWITNVDRGLRRVWHSGSIGTYKSHVWLYPDLNLALYTQVAGPYSAQSSWALILTLHYITDIIMQRPSWLNASMACIHPAPYVTNDAKKEPFSNDKPYRDLQDFVGTYQHPGLPDIVIYESAHASWPHLRMRMGHYMESKLHYNLSENKFHTELDRLYWYENDRIPIKFTNVSGADIDELLILMDTSLSFDHSFAYSRCMVVNTDTTCSSLSSAVNFNELLLVTLVLVVLAMFSL